MAMQRGSNRGVVNQNVGVVVEFIARRARTLISWLLPRINTFSGYATDFQRYLNHLHLLLFTQHTEMIVRYMYMSGIYHSVLSLHDHHGGCLEQLLMCWFHRAKSFAHRSYIACLLLTCISKGASLYIIYTPQAESLSAKVGPTSLVIIWPPPPYCISQTYCNFQILMIVP